MGGSKQGKTNFWRIFENEDFGFEMVQLFQAFLWTSTLKTFICIVHIYNVFCIGFDNVTAGGGTVRMVTKKMPVLRGLKGVSATLVTMTSAASIAREPRCSVS